MPQSQKVFNIGDLVRWKALVMSPAPGKTVKQVEALGVVRKLIGSDTLELKVVNANDACSEYLDALITLSAWHRLPVSTKECEVVA